jgi:tRNA A-37 threonylcarbamoyl transferase component Bud32
MSSAAPPPEPDYSGQTIGEFTVLRKIGQGGMGQVYLAHQQSLKRDVALKILKADLAENATALRRFRAEAEAVARITHANIVQVYSVGEQNGLHYMALEFVEGRNLRDYIARKGPPELPVAIAIIRQIAAALQRANELGLVHRDIKPENILVTRKAEVKVADFGLSRFFAGDTPAINLTQSGVTLGTPLYMSPEQVRGEPTDHRSDLYSFGVTCYHLLSGEPPFKGRTAFEVTIQHVQNEPVPLAALRPDLQADLCAMVHKLMAKRVEDRYQSARDVIRDLGKIREGLPLGLNVTNAAPAAPYFAGMTAVGVPTASAVASTVFLGPPKASRPGAGLAYALAAVVLAGAGFAVAYTWPRGGNAKPGIVAAERSVERIVSTRELDLKAKIDNRATTGEDLLTAMIDLGLLYVQERRWADAEALFKDLESERNPRISRPQEQVHILAGKLGRAIVLARQDRAKESTALFLEALTRTRAGVELPKGSARNLPAAAFAQGFFLRHPDLSQAVAEAIARNAENGSREPKLDWLRSPGSLVTGPKG